MPNAESKIKEELKNLVEEGEDLLTKFKGEIDTVEVSLEYEPWYTNSKSAVNQIAPERLDDFVLCYTVDKGIAMFLSSAGAQPPFIVRELQKLAMGYFARQVGMVKSLIKQIDSILPDIKNLLQADFFDSEIDAASELLTNGHLRAGGIVSGVVLEGHLKSICSKYHVVIAKSKPTLGDYCQELYRNRVIDNAQRSKLEALGAIRNVCAHQTGREPTNGEVQDLVDGTKRVTKMII